MEPPSSPPLHNPNQTNFNPELNLIDSFNHTNIRSSPPHSQTPTSPDTASATEIRVFSCNYCQRKFYSSQALGGHQNAHKRERILAKRGPTTIPFTHHYYASSSLPLHGHYRSFGMLQPHSLIHKPSLHHGNVYRNVGRFDVPRPAMASPPPEMGGHWYAGEERVKINQIDLSLRL